jgi:membrane associated rhomboid family serine protease
MLPIKDDQPRYSTPFVNSFLIGLNILIYFFEWTLDPRSFEGLVHQFGFVPYHLTAFLSASPGQSVATAILPIFTAMFLHQNWMHVLGNMWFLYIFGDNVEDYLGHFRYLTFYLLTGVIAMFAQLITDPRSHLPTIGASGAIAGILGAYFVLYPRARVLTWFFVFVLWLPAWIILGYWFVLQFLSGAATSLAAQGRSVGGVAFWAHVGGFVAGLLLIRIFPERQQRYPYAIG